MNGCFHGGAFWERLGPRFDTLDLRKEVLNADVLDAWFPPAPSVLEALASAPEWTTRTSPPTHAEGLLEAISSVRRIPAQAVIAGSGSSSLMYLALSRWLDRQSRVLLIEPTYGEYAHLCEQVIGAQVDRIVLSAADNWRLDLDLWLSRIQSAPYDLAVLVNPNNPTGQVIPALDLAPILRGFPDTMRVWVDEAYVDYAGSGSLEALAADSANLFVLKSLSKSLALSGMRVAYLVGPKSEIDVLRVWNPPWSVGLLAQIAAVAGLQDPEYYACRYAETKVHRLALASSLADLGFGPASGEGNWVLARCPNVSAAKLVADLARCGVFIRHAGATAPVLGDCYVRIAVKDAATQSRLLDAIEARMRTAFEQS